MVAIKSTAADDSAGHLLKGEDKEMRVREGDASARKWPKIYHQLKR